MMVTDLFSIPRGTMLCFSISYIICTATAQE
uniref:Uncharacterized protein n=1 Tax=Anguilla anguilla TaxID=7936 RepID=A0A0E9VUK5_ANGAN